MTNFTSILDWIRYGTSLLRQSAIYYGHGTDNGLDEATALVLGSLHLPYNLDSSYFSARLSEAEPDEEDRDPERGDDLPDDAHQDAAQEGAAPQGPLLLVRQASRRHLAPSWLSPLLRRGGGPAAGSVVVEGPLTCQGYRPGRRHS